jgi:CHASE1-domain containing sensor protein
VVRRSLPLLRAYAWLLVLAIGLFVTLFACRVSVESDRHRIETEFNRRADIRHTLTREVLNYDGAGLFGLRNLFLADHLPTRAEFDRLTREIIARYPGIASIERAPVVPAGARGEFERQLTAELGHPVQITKTTDGGTRLVPVEPKASYTPVAYITPVAGKEIVFGFDVTTGLIVPAVEHAGRAHTLVVSPIVKLIEQPDRGRLGFLAKPFTREALAAQLRDLLG